MPGPPGPAGAGPASQAQWHLSHGPSVVTGTVPASPPPDAASAAVFCGAAGCHGSGLTPRVRGSE
eukprot:762792-Hanusia_phi.AAC.1